MSGRVAQGQRVEAVNLLGALVEMDAGSDDDTVFAIDPVRRSSYGGSFWEIRFREVDARRRTAHELLELMGNTIESWAVRFLQLDLQSVRAWWSRWGTGSQAQVGPVQASILAHLPLTLHQLDVRECEALRDALKDAQRAQRRREQAPPAQIHNAMNAERAALDKLASLIRDNQEHQHFLWSRVQQLMRRFGYRDDSVLLELAQNADDALSQASGFRCTAAAYGSPAFGARPCSGRRDDHRCQAPRPTDQRYGRRCLPRRPRSSVGSGSVFHDAAEPEWEAWRDPRAKRRRRDHWQVRSRVQVGPSCLGHPSVVSGFVAFSIAGGLLPFEQPVPNDPDLLPADGHRATRVRLPLRKDANEQALLGAFFVALGTRARSCPCS